MRFQYEMSQEAMWKENRGICHLCASSGDSLSRPGWSTRTRFSLSLKGHSLNSPRTTLETCLFVNGTDIEEAPSDFTDTPSWKFKIGK